MPCEQNENEAHIWRWTMSIITINKQKKKKKTGETSNSYHAKETKLNNNNKKHNVKAFNWKQRAVREIPII